MKGISHFTFAIAAATFIPGVVGVVQAAQNEQRQPGTSVPG